MQTQCFQKIDSFIQPRPSQLLALPSSCLRRFALAKIPMPVLRLQTLRPDLSTAINGSPETLRINHLVGRASKTPQLKGPALWSGPNQNPSLSTKRNLWQTSGCLAVASTIAANLHRPTGGPERPRLAPERPHRTGPAGPYPWINYGVSF